MLLPFSVSVGIWNPKLLCSLYFGGAEIWDTTATTSITNLILRITTATIILHLIWNSWILRRKIFRLTPRTPTHTLPSQTDYPISLWRHTFDFIPCPGMDPPLYAWRFWVATAKGPIWLPLPLMEVGNAKNLEIFSFSCTGTTLLTLLMMAGGFMLSKRQILVLSFFLFNYFVSYLSYSFIFHQAAINSSQIPLFFCNYHEQYRLSDEVGIFVSRFYHKSYIFIRLCFKYKQVSSTSSDAGQFADLIKLRVMLLWNRYEAVESHRFIHPSVSLCFTEKNFNCIQFFCYALQTAAMLVVEYDPWPCSLEMKS